MTISLAAIEAADKTATPGPWATFRDSIAASVWVYCGKGQICEIVSDHRELSNDQGDNDAELIALYRNEVPALVAALRAVLALAGEWDDCPYGEFYMDEAAESLRKVIADAGVEP